MNTTSVQLGCSAEGWKHTVGGFMGGMEGAMEYSHVPCPIPDLPGREEMS